MISRDPRTDEQSQAYLRRLKQGEEVPALIGERGKKSPRDSSAPVHRLIATLHDYADTFRRHHFGKHAAYSEHDLVRKLCALPPLSADTWKTWHRVTLEVLKHFSRAGDPANHPAFAREPLRRMLAKKTPLVQQLIGAGGQRRRDANLGTVQRRRPAPGCCAHFQHMRHHVLGARERRRDAHDRLRQPGQ